MTTLSLSLARNHLESVTCETQELVRYIHLNPFRAGAVADLATLERYR